jgi:hypothetical protein
MQCWHWIMSFIKMFWILSEVKHLDTHDFPIMHSFTYFVKDHVEIVSWKQYVVHIHMKKHIFFSAEEKYGLRIYSFSVLRQNVANSINVCIPVIMSVNKLYKKWITHNWQGSFMIMCNRELTVLQLSWTEIKNNELQTVYMQLRN